VPDATDHLFDAITRVDALRGGRLLDVPAGDGRLTARLREANYDVTAADLFPENCGRVPDCVQADMNTTLPFEDDAFDALVCQEGVEHLENLAGFLRECRRVLRDGAHLWLTTPNFMDLTSRAAWLVSGQKGWRTGVPNEQTTLWDRDGERLYHGHAFHLPWFQLRYLLRVHAFDDFVLRGRGWSAVSMTLYPVMRPIVGILLARGLRARQERNRKKGRAHVSDALRETLYREGVSRALLCGKILSVHARLREDSVPQPA
jgi:SAM-dependent methyltransferase